MEVLLVDPIERCRSIIDRTVFHRLAIDVDFDQPVRPIEFLYRSWRNENLLPWPPVLRIDDQVMNAPVGIFDEEVIDVADVAVARMDMVPGYRFDTAKVRIVVTASGSSNVFLATTGPLQRQRRQGASPVAISETAHIQSRVPVRAPAIVIVDIGLDLPRHRSFGIYIRTVLDLLHGQPNSKLTSLRIEVPQGEGRQENFATGEPGAGIDDEPANQPARVVKQEIAHGAEPTITRRNEIAIDGRCMS